MALNSGNASTRFLKLIHVILGAVALGIVAYYSSGSPSVVFVNELFYFQLVTFAFLVTSFSLVATIYYDEAIKKSYFAISYHLFGFIFYISASIALMMYVMKWDYQKDMKFRMHKVAAIVGILNSVAYLASAFLAILARKSR